MKITKRHLKLATTLVICLSIQSLSIKTNASIIDKIKILKKNAPISTEQKYNFSDLDDAIHSTIKFDTSKLLNFNEFIQLTKDENADYELLRKVHYLLNKPIVDNEFWYKNYKPKKNDKIGAYVRVASWNIARGMNLPKIKSMFLDSENFLINISDEQQDKNRIQKGISTLKSSDIIVLNEVDLGMPRTDYNNIAKDLAKNLGYNYTFATEFLEVDPAHLGLEKYIWSEEAFLEKEGIEIKIDPNRYKGMHGNAILSKFPLTNVRIIRLPKSYDWYKREKERATHLELLRRNAAKGIFKEEIIREVRIGSRIALLADVKIPGFDDKVTIVAIHLENRATPKARKEQLKYLFEQIKDINNPVVLAGDFNTTMTDGSPTSLNKEILSRLKDPHYIGRSILLYSNPYGLAINSLAATTNYIRRNTNPAATSFPIIAPNPEKKVFNLIKGFKFSDGNTFDIRGEKHKSINNKAKFMSNSNERCKKGFVPTFIFERNFGVVKYKLDWIFVKAYSHDCDDNSQPNKFAPHFGQTLHDLNYALGQPLSDHTPITVDLPLNEYKKKK